jgi:phosphoribosylglycinamide formyltransferase-1
MSRGHLSVAAKAKRVAVLASGPRGSNAKALIDSCKALDFPADIGLVIADVPDAGALRWARESGNPAELAESKGWPPQEFEAKLGHFLAAHHIDIVCLAGFNRILSAEFVAPWRGRMLNIHPGLLVRHPEVGGRGMHGAHVHAKTLAIGAKESGCTVHFVTPDVDRGPAVVTGYVPVRPNDTPETLAARVLLMERRAYPKALEMVAGGRVLLADDGRVMSTGGVALPGTGVELR